MKITCALSKDNLISIASVIYKDMEASAIKNEPYDLRVLMNDLYSNLLEKQDLETALVYLQQVPAIVGQLAFKIEGVNISLEFDMNRIFSLSKEFRDLDTGIDTVNNFFGTPISGSTLNAIANESIVTTIKTDTDIPDERPVTLMGDDRLKVRLENVFSSTWEEFLQMNPADKIDPEVVENLDKTKQTVYQTLNRLRTAVRGNTLLDSVILDGNKVMLRPVSLDKFPQDLLYPSTAKFKAINQSLTKFGTQTGEVKPIDNHFALVLTDEKGKFLYFDKSGKVTTAEQGGQVVYQMLREVRKKDGVFVITDIYGREEQILGSDQEALMQIKDMDYDSISKYEAATGRKFSDLVEAIESERQLKFEQYYNFREALIKEGNKYLIPITDVSNGVQNRKLLVQTLNLSTVKETFEADMAAKIYESLHILDSPYKSIDKDRAIVMINDQAYDVDRADIPLELANKIAYVLTSPNISIGKKQAFAEQFLSNEVTVAARRHNIIYDTKTKSLEFSYHKYTDQEFQQMKLKNSKVENPLIKLDLKGGETARQKVYEILTQGKATLVKKDGKVVFENDKPKVAKYYPAKMIYNKEVVHNNTYQDYNIETGDFEFKTYSVDLLPTLDAKVNMPNGKAIPLYNSYMMFAIPDKFTDTIAEIKEEQKIIKEPSEIRKKYDELVKRLKDTGSVTATVKSVGAITQVKGGINYVTADVTIDGYEGTFKVYRVFDTTIKKDDTFDLLLNNEVVDGMLYQDTIVGRKNIQGKLYNFGYLQDRDYKIDEARQPIPIKSEEVNTNEEVNEIINTEPIQLDPEPNVKEPEEKDESYIAPPNVPQPGEGNASGILGGDTPFFDRKKILDQTGVTQKQIDDAVSWWESENNPLTPFIELSTASDLVNSDVYARFIAASSYLLSATNNKPSPDKLGVIAVNALNGGNYVDVYHESWHAFSQLFLTKDQKIKLYKEVRNSNPKYKKLSYFEIEEMLAEDFRDYARNPDKAKVIKQRPIRNTLFRKILNFLKALFGKGSKADLIDPNIVYQGVAQEMFEKLYFAGQSKEAAKVFMNEFTPLIDNVQFNMLDRGMISATDKKLELLNDQDSRQLTSAIDSAFSQIVDENAYKTNSKSGTTRILSNELNREIAYEYIRKDIEKKLAAFKTELNLKPVESFNDFKSLEDLEGNAIAIIRSKKGDHKYIFLKGQVDSFTNLNADTKGGERVKGRLYKDKIEIIGDFYEHKSITNSAGNANILVVDSIEDAKAQFDDYVKGKATSMKAIEMNFNNVFLSPKLNYEQQELQGTIRIMETALANWDSVIKHHRKNSDYDIVTEKFIPLEEDPENQAPLDAEKSRDERYADKKVGDISLEQMANKETIYILKSLFKKVKKGTKYVDEFDRFGYKKRANFRSIWNMVVRTTNSTKDPILMYKKLVAASEQYPELKQLIDFKLPNPEGKESLNESRSFDVTTSFWSDFSRPKIPYLQLLAYNDGSEFTVEITDAAIDIVKTIRNFEAKFKSDSDQGFVEKDNNISKLNLQAIVENFKNRDGSFNDEKNYRFLNSIGIYLDNLTNIKGELNDLKQRSKYNVPRIYDTIKLIYEASLEPNLSKAGIKLINDFRMNPIKIMREGIPANVLGKPNSKLFIEGLSQRTVIDNIIRLQNTYGREGVNFSVLNPERNRVNLHTDDNTATVIVDGINTTTKKTDLWEKMRFLNSFDPRINAYTNRLQIFKALYQPNGERRTDRSLEVIMAAGTQLTMSDEFLSGTNTTNLDGQGKLIQEFHMMLKSGIQEFMRPGSKSSSFGVRLLGGYLKAMGASEEKYLYADISEFIPQNNAERDVIERIILPYLAGETERINKFKNDPNAKNYVGYNLKVDDSGTMAGETFTAFKGILNKKTQKEILEKVKDPSVDLVEYLKSDSKLKTEIIDQIKAYFTIRSKDIYDRLNKGKFIDPKLIARVPVAKMATSEKEMVLAKAYMYNAWIHNFETSVLFLGDLAQYNHAKEELHKRISGLISNGPRFRTDIAAQLFMQNTGPNSWKGTGYAATLGEGYQNFKYDGTFNTAIIEDVTRNSVYIDIIKKALENDYKKRYVELPPAEADKIIKERVAKEIKKYTSGEMIEGDGQGYITIDAYRTLKKLQNRWTDKQEALFQKIINNQELSAEDYIEHFPPYKLQYFGALQDTSLPVTAFHKFALMPLVPSAIEGSDLEVLHKEMIRNNVQYATFGSGSKVGTVTSNGQLDQVYEPGSNQKKIKSKIDFTKNRINVEFLKEVTTVPNKFKGQVIFSTQLRKLILEGLFFRGELLKGEYAPLANKYQELVSSYTELLKEQLLTEIGYTKKNGIYVGNPAKLLKLMKQNLASKDMPSHLLDALKTNKDGSLRYDLSNFIDAQTLERTVLSIVENRFVKQKLNGEALVQVASSMTNGLWNQSPKFKAGSQEDILKYMGTNNLPFYYPGEDGKTNAMKVAIALQGDFLNLLNLNHNDGQPIGTRLRLNEMIKDDEWLNKDNNRKAVTMTAVRIPVQGLNSMEFMEVWEFLDTSAGNIIIPPTELVAKSGGDYDVDKLTTFMPNIDKDGNVFSSEMGAKELLEAANALEGADKMKALNDAKKVMENELITQIRSILEIPDNYANLVRPNDTYMLKDIADELSDVVIDYDRFQTVNNELGTYDTFKNKKIVSPTTTLEPLYNIYKHNANMIGKAVLGIAANENAFSPLFNSIGAKMPKTYKESFFNQSTNRYEDVQDTDKKEAKEFVTRLLLRHNKTPNGNISLSDINSFDAVNKIADLFSQGMNGWVDVEKDDWIFYIQGNLEISPVLLYLLKAGVPVREAIMFVSTPLIREYAERQRLIKSPYATLMGIAPTEPQYAQYQASVDVLMPAAEAHLFRTLDKLKFDKNKFTGILVTYWDSSGLVTKKVTRELTLSELNDGEDPIQELKSLFENSEDVRPIFIQELVDIKFTNKNDRKQNETVYTRPQLSNAGIYDTATFFSENEVDRLGYLDPKRIEGLVKSKSKEDKYSDLSIAAFTHFIEIQKYLKGMGELKRTSKPDAQTFKTIQEILLRDLKLKQLGDYSKVDDETQRRLTKESIVSSLGDKKIITDIIAPLFPLRNNKTVLNVITKALAQNSQAIGKRYGGINNESVSKFIEDFKNALNNFILQNYLTHNINEKGQIVLVPNSYKKMDVIKSKTLDTDVEIIKKDGKSIMKINPDRIEQDFKDKVYLANSSSPNRYSLRGLNAFAIADDVFTQKSEYFRYVIEREYLKSEGLNQDEINQVALFNSYNPTALMGKTSFSFTTELLDTIKNNYDILSKYEVVSQLALYPFSKDLNLLTLNNKDLLDGVQSDIYAQEIRELGNPRIQKTSDTALNKKISRLFYLLPLVGTYQHGVGKTIAGFNEILPQDLYLSVMKNASDNFIQNYFNADTLDFIVNQLLADKSKFKNYTSADAYNIKEYVMEGVDEIEEFSGEEVEVIEEPPIELGGTDAKVFKFSDGIEIETPFKLNVEQEAALLALEKFYKNPENYNNEITLVGYAGTGKTSIMKIFNEYLYEVEFAPKILYSSPTHRANAVTKLNNPGVKVATLHKIFGFGPDVDFEGSSYDVKDLEFKQVRPVGIDNNTLLIIDESSMVSDELYEFLTKNKQKYNLKIVYMGDPGQLGPVQKTGAILSKVFTNPTSQVKLTKVERTGDNPILKESTALRSGGTLSYISDEVKGKGVEYTNNSARENQIIAENLLEMKKSENYLYFRILAATNPKVAELNTLARDILWGPRAKTEEFIVGDVLMGYDNIGTDFKTGEAKIYNSGDYIVTAVESNVKEMISLPKTEEQRFPNGKLLVFEGSNVTLQNALDPKAKPVTIFIASKNSVNDTPAEDLADAIHQLNFYGKTIAGKDRRQAAKYFEGASNLSKQVIFTKAVNGKDKRAKIKKGVDYGYAHTIHKSQGGTYTKVMLFDNTIPFLVDYIKDNRNLTDAQAEEMKRQLRYVAVSRATDYVYVSTNLSGGKGSGVGPVDPTLDPFETIGTFSTQDIKPTQSSTISAELLEIIERDRAYHLKRGAMRGSDGFWYSKSKEEINAFYDNEILNTQPSTQPTSVNNPKDYTNHSGGAALSDTEWDQIGREFGVTNHKHYREPLDYVDTKGEAAKGSKTLDSKKLQAAGIEPTHISQKDYNEGAQKATKAFRMMYTDSENKSVRSAYIIRNWLQVKNADAIFALGTIKQPGENASDKAGETRIAAVPIVKGGTGYAVQMAINEGKPVYVFDGTKEGWYKYDYSIKNFVKTDTPTLTKNFAGIGSRTLSTKEVIDKSLQAIREIYEKTFGTSKATAETPGNIRNFGPGLVDNSNLNNQLGLNEENQDEDNNCPVPF
jgi:exodeoxyribonuclease-5